MPSTRARKGKSKKEAIDSSFRSEKPPKNLKWLTAFMRQLAVGNAVLGDEDGMCFGVAAHATQAILLDDLDKFDRRLKKMHQLYLQDKASNASLDMLAFLNVIELLNQPYQHPEIFNRAASMQQSIEEVLPLVMSENLEKIGGMKAVANFTGIYRKQEFNQYLKSLEESILDSNATKPVALLLQSYDHAISIGFDPKSNSWCLIDADNNLLENNLITKQLANGIHHAFGDEKNTAFSTKMYVPGNQLETGKNIADKWINHASWKELHDTDTRHTRQQQNNVTWLMIAAHQNDLVKVKELISSDVEINKKLSDGVSALFLAALNGHHEIMDVLIAAGADAEASQQGNVTPLFVAAKRGHVKCVESLLTAGADIDSAREQDGATPLMIAVINNQVDVIKRLLTKGANANLARRDDNLTPLMVAALNGYQETAAALIAAGADPTICYYDGNSPADLASQNGHHEIAQLYQNEIKRRKADEPRKNDKCCLFNLFKRKRAKAHPHHPTVTPSDHNKIK